MFFVLWAYGPGMSWHCASPVFPDYRKAQQYIDRNSRTEDTAGRVWKIVTGVDVEFSAKSADTLVPDAEGRN